MKILLCCDAGASTSMVVESMKKALTEEQKANYVINADTYQNFENVYKNYDVVLIGPHIRYKKAGMVKVAEGSNIPVEVIDATDYALQNGIKVLDFARKLYADAHK